MAVCWSVVLAATGGFTVSLGMLAFASHDIGRPLVIAIAAAAATVAQGWHSNGRRAAADEARWWYDRGRSIALAIGRQAARHAHLLPIAIAVAVVGVDLWQWLAATPLWLDEQAIAINARDRAFLQLGGALWLGQSAPVWWLALERAALLVFGTNEIAVRLVPLFFGMALVATALWIGRRWLGTTGASVLVLLCAFGRWVTHLRFETKHYTADAAFALFLPALAVWALEAEPADRRRRIVLWWCAAAIGQLFANGATFVAPGCAIFLFLASAHRGGRRAAATVAVSGLIWLAVFAVHYELALRYTLGSTYLQAYWHSELPPPGAAASAKLSWITARLRPLAENPGGTGAPTLLWISAAGGFAAGASSLGVAYALVPLAAFVLAFLHVVPLFERLSIWMVPALYVGIALLVDRAVRAAHAIGPRRALRIAAAVGILAVEGWLCTDIAQGGIDRATARWTPIENDRQIVRWLLRARQPGDALMTTRLGWPALYWYGGVSLAGSGTAVGSLPDGAGMFRMTYAEPAACTGASMRERVAGARRVLVYLGFRDVPQGFDRLLLREFGGAVTKAEQADGNIGLIVDFDARAPGAVSLDLLNAPPAPDTPLAGCVGVSREVRW